MHTQSTEYVKQPRPILGWIVFGLGLLVRLWALPFAVLGWFVGTLAGAFGLGFAFAWETPEFEAAQRLRAGRQTATIVFGEYDDSEDEDA
jgi:hypothetical protein